MLLNSDEFLFVFLPITLIGYYLLGSWNRRVSEPRYPSSVATPLASAVWDDLTVRSEL